MFFTGCSFYRLCFTGYVLPAVFYRLLVCFPFGRLIFIYGHVDCNHGDGSRTSLRARNSRVCKQEAGEVRMWHKWEATFVCVCLMDRGRSVCVFVCVCGCVCERESKPVALLFCRGHELEEPPAGGHDLRVWHRPC